MKMISIALISLVLTLAGCSDSDKSDSSAPPATGDGSESLAGSKSGKTQEQEYVHTVGPDENIEFSYLCQFDGESFRYSYTEKYSAVVVNVGPGSSTSELAKKELTPVTGDSFSAISFHFSTEQGSISSEPFTTVWAIEADYEYVSVAGTSFKKAEIIDASIVKVEVKEETWGADKLRLEVPEHEITVDCEKIEGE